MTSSINTIMALVDALVDANNREHAAENEGSDSEYESICAATVDARLAVKKAITEAVAIQHHSASQPAPISNNTYARLTDDEIESFGHRLATKYTHRTDPTYRSYGFVRHTLISFARAVERHHGII